MIDQQINEQLGLLQEELSRLKSVTDYIDTAKANSASIVAELEKIQQNYATQLNKLSELHRQSVIDLQKSAEAQIGEGALRFEQVGNIIENTNRENLAETRRLLDQYKNTVDATGALIKQIENVDFPARLSVIENETKDVSVTLRDTSQVINKNATENHATIIQTLSGFFQAIGIIQNEISSNHREASKLAGELDEKTSKHLVDQDKEIRALKVVLFVACGLISAVIAGVIYIIIKQHLI